MKAVNKKSDLLIDKIIIFIQIQKIEIIKMNALINLLIKTININLKFQTNWYLQKYK